MEVLCLSAVKQIHRRAARRKLVRLDKGAVLPAGLSPCQQVRYVIDGRIAWGGKTCDSVSMMYCPPNMPYPEIRGEADSTVLFVAQWASLGGTPPAFAVL